MKKKWLFLLSLLLLQFVALSQKMITLDEFITFSEYKTNVDFISFNKKYNYALYESNLAKAYIYDDLGFVKDTKLKKFNKLKNGDSLLYNRIFKISRSRKRSRVDMNNLSFFKKRDTLLIQFSTTSHVVGSGYFDQMNIESQNQGFETLSTDTVYYERYTTISHECRKGDYYLKCSFIKKTEDPSVPSEEIKFKIDFIKMKEKRK